MSGPTPKPGERWRVADVFEGTVVAVRGPLVEFEHDVQRWLDVGGRSWERLPDPEPDYPIGTAWHSPGDGLTYLRTRNGWLWHRGGVIPLDMPTRPLIPLLPERTGGAGS